MKDAFGRDIHENDVVVYATRHGSSTYMNVAKVIKAEEGRVRVQTVAGTDYNWKNGKMTRNQTTRQYEYVPYEGHFTWLHASGNVIVSNGIDAMGIHDKIVSEQRENLAKR